MQLYVYRLDLSCTLIRHESRAFLKALFKPEGFENTGFVFSVECFILIMQLFEDDDVMIIT